MPSGVKICVVGKGGREHALIRALGESASQPEVFCFPGSEAIHEIEGAGRVDAHDLDTLIAWMTAESIDLCVAGEESCLLYTSPSPRDLSTSRMPSSA